MEIQKILAVLYFIGLIIFSVAVGRYYHNQPLGFGLIGGGTILFTIVVGLGIYLKMSHWKDDDV